MVGWRNTVGSIGGREGGREGQGYKFMRGSNEVDERRLLALHTVSQFKVHTGVLIATPFTIEPFM